MGDRPVNKRSRRRKPRTDGGGGAFDGADIPQVPSSTSDSRSPQLSQEQARRILSILRPGSEGGGAVNLPTQPQTSTSTSVNPIPESGAAIMGSTEQSQPPPSPAPRLVGVTPNIPVASTRRTRRSRASSSPPKEIPSLATGPITRSRARVTASSAAGPGTSAAGPSTSAAGPSTSAVGTGRAGPGPSAAGPSAAGPGTSRAGPSAAGPSTSAAGPSRAGPSAAGPRSKKGKVSGKDLAKQIANRYDEALIRLNNTAALRNGIIGGFNTFKPPGGGRPLANERRYFGINEYSYFRDGLMSINYSTNVRDFSNDVTRQQGNKLKKMRKEYEDLEMDTKYQYSVYNSDPEFDVNTELTIDEILLRLRVNDLRDILQSFGNIPTSTYKQSLIQQVKSLSGSQDRNNYIRRYYSNVQQQLKFGKKAIRNNPNETLLVSNVYRYKRSHFEGMTMKEILQSLFDNGDHLTFLYNRVLESKKIPLSREERIEKAFKNIIEQTNKKVVKLPQVKGARGTTVKNYIRVLTENYLQTAEPIVEKVCIPLAEESDRILIENSRLVLSILFAAKNRFFIGIRPYTILNYHNETIVPINEEEREIEFDMMARNGIYVEYPMFVHITLSDKPPDEITSKDIQKAKCHNQWQKVRKNWHEISVGTVQTRQGPVDKAVFERRFNRPMKSPLVGIQEGGKKTRSKKKYLNKNRTRKRKQ